MFREKPKPKMVSVTTIIQNVKYSCDFGSIEKYSGETEDEKRTNFWLHAIANKANDTGFGHLVESILENGWDRDSFVGWDDDNCINEGHHRIVAAILLCLDEIPVCDWGRDGVRRGIDRSDKLSAHGCPSDPYPISVF